MPANLRRWIVVVGAFAATAFEVSVPIWAGLHTPNYSHLRQYLSELGQTGAPMGRWVSIAGFLPIGVLILTFLLALKTFLPSSRRATWGIIAAMGVGIGYIAAGLAPCDPGCPTWGTLSQNVHTVTGYYHYGGAILGLGLFLSVFRTQRVWRNLVPITTLGIVLAVVGAAGMIILPGWKGAFQRVAELGFFGWACFTAWNLATRRAPVISQPTIPEEN